jgi:hypothetical protein
MRRLTHRPADQRVELRPLYRNVLNESDPVHVGDRDQRHFSALA